MYWAEYFFPCFCEVALAHRHLHSDYGMNMVNLVTELLASIPAQLSTCLCNSVSQEHLPCEGRLL